ncbi:MAG: glycine--tRNA ligase [Candidatus Babeliaceae bacterium]|jgi:glycyl-tRNA synthetase
MEHTPKNAVTLEKIVALCKRRGFIFPSNEIYGGLNGVYDIGHLGTALKNKIRAAWTKNIESFASSYQSEILFLEGALLGTEALWEASGHVSNFHDPMVDCLTCKHRYRSDDINLNGACPHCGNKTWSAVREFNMMFKTELGATAGLSSTAYLRPETAQSIFINFKNIYSSSRIKIPCGIAQIGKAFRNEITPKQFIFRMREFEQMEIEWFCQEQDAQRFFEAWCDQRCAFYKTIGINPDNIRVRAHEKEELSHYSRGTSDVEYRFPFGWKELEGIANRGNFDLAQHSTFSGKDLSVFDEASKTSYIPHVVECSVGVDRLFLTILCDAYAEEEVDGEVRTVLRLKPSLAPVPAAFFPLTKQQEEPMKKIYAALRAKNYAYAYDVSGSIGKRYRRFDEIGTPVCFTYDFDSAQDNCVTARHRDTMVQERISIDNIEKYIIDILQK